MQSTSSDNFERKLRIVYDTGDTIDGVEFESVSFYEARGYALNILSSWIAEEVANGTNLEKSLHDCMVWLEEWSEETNEWEEIWCPSDSTLKAMGFPTDDQ